MKALAKVISGGQTGVDQAALRAAAAAGIPTGGWAPRGWQTEDGPAPWLTRYGMLPHAGTYAARNRANIAEADATLVLSWRRPTGGTALTVRLCAEAPAKPSAVQDLARLHGASVQMTAAWIELAAEKVGRALVLNVAGPRESKSPGVGDKAEAFLAEVFAALKECDRA